MHKKINFTRASLATSDQLTSFILGLNSEFSPTQSPHVAEPIIPMYKLLIVIVGLNREVLPIPQCGRADYSYVSY